jgi:hypothetical protein
MGCSKVWDIVEVRYDCCGEDNNVWKRGSVLAVYSLSWNDGFLVSHYFHTFSIGRFAVDSDLSRRRWKLKHHNPRKATIRE